MWQYLATKGINCFFVLTIFAEEKKALTHPFPQNQDSPSPEIDSNPFRYIERFVLIIESQLEKLEREVRKER